MYAKKRYYLMVFIIGLLHINQMGLSQTNRAVSTQPAIAIVVTDTTLAYVAAPARGMIVFSKKDNQFYMRTYNRWTTYATTAFSGLTAIRDSIRLGGLLTGPTVIAATDVNTLAITGLKTSSGSAALSDSVVMIDGNGVLKKIRTDSLLQRGGWTNAGNLNTNSATNYIGTNDLKGFSIRTNGTEHIHVDSLYRVGINTGTPAEALEVKGNVKVDSTLTAVRYLATAGTAYTSATSPVTVDLSTGNLFTISVNSSFTLAVSNSTKPATYLLKLVYSATGAYTVTWPANFLWSGGLAPTLTNTSGKTDMVGALFDGTNYYCSYALNY